MGPTELQWIVALNHQGRRIRLIVQRQLELLTKYHGISRQSRTFPIVRANLDDFLIGKMHF